MLIPQVLILLLYATPFLLHFKATLCGSLNLVHHLSFCSVNILTLTFTFNIYTKLNQHLHMFFSMSVIVLVPLCDTRQAMTVTGINNFFLLHWMVRHNESYWTSSHAEGHHDSFSHWVCKLILHLIFTLHLSYTALSGKFCSHFVQFKMAASVTSNKWPNISGVVLPWMSVTVKYVLKWMTVQKRQ